MAGPDPLLERLAASCKAVQAAGDANAKIDALLSHIAFPLHCMTSEQRLSLTGHSRLKKWLVDAKTVAALREKGVEMNESIAEVLAKKLRCCSVRMLECCVQAGDLGACKRMLMVCVAGICMHDGQVPCRTADAWHWHAACHVVLTACCPSEHPTHRCSLASLHVA